MEPVTTITGSVAVLDRADVDTDQIIPKQFLKRIERTGFGEFLFFDWIRSGEIELSPAPILVAGKNFGCGSSREHAVWALAQYGFKAVIAPSFSDIFSGNCAQNGFLAIALGDEDVRALMSAGEATIDLPAQTVTFGDRVARFEIESDTKHRLVNGLDEIGLTLQHAATIDAYERERALPTPSTTAL